MRRALLGLLFSIFSSVSALAGVNCTLPVILLPNTLADATQVMSNFNALVSCLLNAAAAGQNNDITALNALSTPLNVTQGGTPLFLGGTSDGSINDQTVATTVPSGYLQSSQSMVAFYAGASNTGEMSLNVAATGQTALYNQSPNGPIPMTGGEVIAGQVVVAVYNNTVATPPTTHPTWNPGYYECINCGGVQHGGFGPPVTVPAAATVDLGKVGTHNVLVNGTTAITSFGASAAPAFPVYLVLFNNALTLTNTNTACLTTGGCLVLPGNANIQTQPGDAALAMLTSKPVGGANNWAVLSYQRQSGAAVFAGAAPCGFNHLDWGNGTSNNTVTASWDSASLVNPATGASLYSGPQTGKTMSTTISGPAAGGLDGHPLANGIFIYMYAISNGSSFDLLGSTLASGPTMPTGYSFLCYMGAIRLTALSTNMLGTRGRGREAHYVVNGANLAAGLLTVINGVQGNCATPVMWSAPTIVPNFAPANAVAFDFVITNNYQAAGVAITAAAPNTNYGQTTSNPPMISLNATSAVAGNFRFSLEGPTIAFCGAAAGSGMFAYGWVDAVHAN